MQLFEWRENENLVKSFKNHSVEIRYKKKLNVTTGIFFFLIWCLYVNHENKDTNGAIQYSIRKPYF